MTEIEKKLEQLNQDLAVAKRDLSEKLAAVGPAKKLVDQIEVQITELGRIVARQEQTALMASPSKLRGGE